MDSIIRSLSDFWGEIRMKMLSVVVILFASATWLRAADPEGFALWKAAAVNHSGKELASKIDDQRFAWQSLGTYQNHLIGISHREGDGSAELHETQVDILIVESGEATLVVGGTMVEPKTAKPHEVRGSSIEGGEMKQLSPGDIVHIPAKIPHQLKIAAGKTFTYLVIKVDSQ
jgi:mannose-6-phosphate isomerase-like protein (cupin superfamily)